MAARSAGILLYRIRNGAPEVLLVHPGGPFWGKKDLGAWSIPKGEFAEGDDGLTVARREFEEELGQPAPDGKPIELGSVKQAGGKQVFAWALVGDLNADQIVSNTFEMEWPPRSGTMQEFPEVDRAEWLGLSQAAAKINASQAEFLRALAEHLKVNISTAEPEPPEPDQPSLF